MRPLSSLLLRACALPALLLGAAACSDSPTAPPSGGGIHRDISVGALVRLNVNATDACTKADYRVGRVVAKSTHAIVVADTANPSEGLSDAEYRTIAGTFDELVYPVVTGAFGTPADIDENGRVVIFYTRAVNELTPKDQGWYTGGFFFARDLFPQKRSGTFEACAGSNAGEVLYMLVADPSGKVNGNPRPRELVLNSTVGVLGHELQHLINASRRLHVLRITGASWSEEAWLNEGLSHVAEELLGHHAAGSAPRQNLDADRVRGQQRTREAFDQYHSPNFGRLQNFLERPDSVSLLSNEAGLAARGAAWTFLRYAADRRGGDEVAFWKGLVDSNQIGAANLEAAIGADPLLWLRDWVVSAYTDDAVAGIGTQHRQPSWNFRSIYPALQVGGDALARYPLRTIQPTPGVETQVELRGGGGAYVRFGVATGGRGEVRTAGAATSCAAGGPAVTLGVGEAYTATGDAARSICLNGGTTGAEFVWIPFHASATSGSRLALGVTTLGTVPVLGPPSPSRAVAGPLALAAAGARAPLAVAPQPDDAWEASLREREVRELSRLVPGGAARLAPSIAPAAAASDLLHVVVVRTK
jgi:hypothetical protein